MGGPPVITADMLRALGSRAHVNLRALLDGADKLHPASLVVLVGVLLAVGDGAGVVLVAAAMAVITAVAALLKAGAVVAAGWLLVRLAYRLAAQVPTRAAP